jgi:hypothetical protein
VEFRLIKVELTVKLCGYQSTGRSAMCEHNTTKRKSVKIENNSETNSGWKKKIVFHRFIFFRAV